MYYLMELTTGQSYALGPNHVVMGRQPGHDGLMSEYHAVVFWHEQACMIADLGSEWGTRINGELISQPVQLTIGDDVTLGDTRLKLIQTTASAPIAQPLCRGEADKQIHGAVTLSGISLSQSWLHRLAGSPAGRGLQIIKRRLPNFFSARRLLSKMFLAAGSSLQPQEAAIDQRTRMKEQFLTMVSHDLRTPLTTLQGALTLLKDERLDRQTANTVLGQATRNVNRLIKLAGDLLDLDTVDAGQFKMRTTKTHLDRVIEQAVEAVEMFAQERSIMLAAEGTNVIVNADEQRLVQVLVNLLENAVKFSPAGETVMVRVVAFKSAVQVQVIDKGRGVPEKLRESIFERYRQAEPDDAFRKRGCGLGLAICRAIVEQHGGTIGVDSCEGAGSVFWFMLPSNTANDCRQSGEGV